MVALMKFNICRLLGLGSGESHSLGELFRLLGQTSFSRCSDGSFSSICQNSRVCLLSALVLLECKAR